MTVGQPAGAAFIQEIDVFNEETEEGNHNLEERDGNRFTRTYINNIAFGVFYLSSRVLCALLPSPGCCVQSQTSGLHHEAQCGSC